MASSFIEKAFPTLAKVGKKDKGGKDKGTAAPTAPKRGKRKIPKPVLPQVDLLPPNLVLQVRRRQLRFGFLVAGLVLIILIALAYVLQTTRASVETAALAQSQQQVAAAQRELDQFTPIVAYLDEAAKREELANRIATSSVNYQETLATLASGLPSGTYQSIAITPNLAPADDAAAQLAFVEKCGPKTDPFGTESPPTTGCVNIAGTAPDRAAITALTATLRGAGRYGNVYLLTSASTPTGVPFQGSYTILRDDSSQEVGQ